MRTVTRIALLAVLAAACKEKAAPPPAPSVQQDVEVEMEVEMVRQGAMPHQPLRYQLTRGVKTAIELEVDVEIATPSFQRTMPTAVTVMELGAEDVRPDGDAKVRTRILRASARARPGAQGSLEAANAQAAMLNGLEIAGTLTSRGKLTGARIAGGAGLPAKATDGLAALVAQAEEVAMPLPEAGVGVGAIWRVRRHVVQLGIELESITELEVTALEPRRVTYAMRTELRGADQRATIDGVAVDVAKIRGTGTGTGVIDLGRMAVFGDQVLELGFDLSAGSQAGSVKMRTARRTRPAAEGTTAAPPSAPPDAGAARPAEQAPAAPGAHQVPRVR